MKTSRFRRLPHLRVLLPLFIREAALMLYQGQGAQVVLWTHDDDVACYGAIMLINHRGLSLFQLFQYAQKVS